MNKTCTKCKETKPIEEFWKGGVYHKSQCRACMKGDVGKKEYLKEYVLKNKERLNLYRAKYYIDNKKKIQKIHKKYRVENKVYIMAYKKKWAYKYKTKRKKTCQKYYLKNKTRLDKISLENSRKYTLALSDSYVRSTIANGGVLQARDIPKELIELKKLYLILIREAKKWHTQLKT